MIPSRRLTWPVPETLRMGIEALGVELDPHDRITAEDLHEGVCLRCRSPVWIWAGAAPAIPFEIWERRDGLDFLRIHPCWLQQARCVKRPQEARSGVGGGTG